MVLQKQPRLISALAHVGDWILSRPALLEDAIEKSYHQNRWFIPEFSRMAIENIAHDFLTESALNHWLEAYPNLPARNSQKVGLILAGNLPLVGFHDVLAVWLSGHEAHIKLSSKDQVFYHLIWDRLNEQLGADTPKTSFVDFLPAMDAYIATGSNNTYRYFEHYLGKYPHVIRKNRNSLAILSGDESKDELIRLGDDVFRYFGLGCRNVSQLWMPKGFDLEGLMTLWQHEFGWIMDYDIYKNNYDYQRTLWLLRKDPHLATDSLLWIESPYIASPIATIHYQFWQQNSDWEQHCAREQENIQCIVKSKERLPFIALGQTQRPGLFDYADGIDVMNFLQELGH